MSTSTARHIPNTDVAKLVRRDLKSAFAGTKFSVRTNKYSGGSSIDVTWTDGPTTAQVDALVSHYCGASFDGMTDMKNYHDTAVVGENGPEVVHYGNDYIFTNREFSTEGIDRVIEQIAADNPWRSFSPEFRGEILSVEDIERFAPVDGRAAMNSYLYRGWDLIRLYTNGTAL